MKVTVEITKQGRLILDTPAGKIECHSEWQIAAVLCRLAGHWNEQKQAWTQTETFEEWEKRTGQKIKVEEKPERQSKLKAKVGLKIDLADLDL